MPAIIVVAGLVIFFLVAKSRDGGDSSASSPGGPGPSTGLPDPLAHAPLDGSGQAVSLPSMSTAITPFPGTAKLSPGTTLGRMNVGNRLALQGMGRVALPRYLPTPAQVRTTNPAITPFSAAGTRAFNGGTVVNSRNPSGIKL